MRRIAALFGILVWLVGLAAAPAQAETIIMMSTTSTQNSGLLDVILPQFTAETGVEVHVVAVGTGQALKNARNGDGDIVMVHARELEDQFVAEGWGLERHDVMFNDFVVVGPAADPAGLRGMTDATAAFARLAEKQARFASRGDSSGTHIRELALWKAAGIDPTTASGQWYHETGTGMGATLNIGVEMGAYILTDRSTWMSFGNKQDYQILVEGDPPLFNQYGVIIVNPARHPHVKLEAAKKLQDWLLDPERGQKAIAAYKIDGQQLFFPNAHD